MANKYDKMTQEEFDEILFEIALENAGSLMTIPGVYEAVSEYYNDDVLEKWEVLYGGADGEE